jgi:hypothetical protein
MTKNYVSLVGGLGNQLFQYANARANNPEKKLQLIFEFGVKNQKHSLNKEITDLTIDNYDSITFVKRLFRVKRILHNLILRTSSPCKNQAKFLSIRRFSHSIAKLIFNCLHLGRISVISQTGIGYSNPGLETNQKNTFQIGYFQHHKWDNYELVYNHLKSLSVKDPSPVFLDYTNSFLSKKVLIVHCRLGDYALEKNFGIPTKRYFDNAINYQLNQMDYDELVFFTNDKSGSDKFIDRKFKARVIAEDSGLSASETLELMRLGSGYVISNSTFSWWGAFLSRSENALVVCPTPWFIALKEPQGLIPPNWIRMEHQ